MMALEGQGACCWGGASPCACRHVATTGRASRRRRCRPSTRGRSSPCPTSSTSTTGWCRYGVGTVQNFSSTWCAPRRPPPLASLPLPPIPPSASSPRTCARLACPPSHPDSFQPPPIADTFTAPYTITFTPPVTVFGRLPSPSAPRPTEKCRIAVPCPAVKLQAASPRPPLSPSAHRADLRCSERVGAARGWQTGGWQAGEGGRLFSPFFIHSNADSFIQKCSRLASPQPSPQPASPQGQPWLHLKSRSAGFTSSHLSRLHLKSRSAGFTSRPRPYKALLRRGAPPPPFQAPLQAPTSEAFKQP